MPKTHIHVPDFRLRPKIETWIQTHPKTWTRTKYPDWTKMKDPDVNPSPWPQTPPSPRFTNLDFNSDHRAWPHTQTLQPGRRSRSLTQPRHRTQTLYTGHRPETQSQYSGHGSRPKIHTHDQKPWPRPNVQTQDLEPVPEFGPRPKTEPGLRPRPGAKT